MKKIQKFTLLCLLPVLLAGEKMAKSYLNRPINSSRIMSTREMQKTTGGLFRACNNYQCPARNPGDPVPVAKCNPVEGTGGYNIVYYRPHKVCGFAFEDSSCSNDSSNVVCSETVYYDDCLKNPDPTKPDEGINEFGSPNYIVITCCA